MGREASCSCGQLSARCWGEPESVKVCHCLECQRQSGSAFSVLAHFRLNAVRHGGKVATYTRGSDAGFEVTRHFCPHCGSTVWTKSTRTVDLIAVPVGAFADPSFTPPDREVHQTTKHPWLLI